jgi:hypothetical protein
MAGGISDGQEYGFVFLGRFRKSFQPPGIPVHRIIGMLEKIGAFLVRQTVSGHFVLLECFSRMEPVCVGTLDNYGYLYERKCHLIYTLC